MFAYNLNDIALNSLLLFSVFACYYTIFHLDHVIFKLQKFNNVIRCVVALQN